jgi:uncharacterized lipoprotein
MKLFSKIIGLSLIVVLLLVACDIDNKQSRPTKDDLKSEIISNYKKVAPTNTLTFFTIFCVSNSFITISSLLIRA